LINKISDNILGYQNNNSQYAKQIGLYNNEYQPGTFTIGEISENCRFLEKPISFEQWITEAINDEIDLIKKFYPHLYDPITYQNLVQRILLILNNQNEMCCPLKNTIFYQEYPDILRRLMLFLTINNPDHELDIYPNLKQDRKIFISNVIDFLEQQDYGLSDWLHFSIAAGMLGINEKSVHAATSVINTDMAIRLPSGKNFSNDDVTRVSKEIVDIARSKCRIDATRHFFQTLERDQLLDISMISLPDDYLETIFLLKYYEKLLKKYSKLKIICIPKSKICGNDATYKDIQDLTEIVPYLKNNPVFKFWLMVPLLVDVI
jgi:hypothetical protein